jgi:ubiquinone biosynthesis protein UbiJ
MQGHILEEWRIQDVERKAENANRRLYELDSLRSDVDRLECANRELCSQVDGLRSALEACAQKLEELERAQNDQHHTN